MDKDEIIRKVKEFAEKVAREFQVNKIILFGSSVRGTFSDISDIDVAVILKSLDVDLLESEFKLFKMRRDIDYRIEPIIFIGEEDKSGFLEEILKSGTVVYQAA